MRNSTRWTLVFAAIAAAIVAALALQLGGSRPAPVPHEQPGAATGAAVPAELRRLAALPACPAGSGGSGPPALRDVSVGCAADGAQVDVARALAGGPVVLNLWAYWCGPCADELPALAE